VKKGSVESGVNELKSQAEFAGPTVRTLDTTLLLNLSSTTEPIQRRNGSVVELKINSYCYGWIWSITVIPYYAQYGILLNGDAVRGSHLANDHHRFGLPRIWNELQ
jgi:hypothetical protein